MKRALPPLLVLAVSLAAGAWLLRPSPTVHDEPAGESCEQDGSVCVGLPALAAEAPAPLSDPAADGQPPAEEPARPAAAMPPAQPPPTVADGKKLREEADRLLAEGNAREGIEALRKATEADPSAKNHGDLGRLLQRMTAMDEAVRHLRRAAELDPGNADRWIELANAYYRSVNPGEAWKAERRAREAEPGLVLGRDASGMRVRRSDSAGAGQ